MFNKIWFANSTNQSKSNLLAVVSRVWEKSVMVRGRGRGRGRGKEELRQNKERNNLKWFHILCVYLENYSICNWKVLQSFSINWIKKESFWLYVYCCVCWYICVRLCACMLLAMPRTTIVCRWPELVIWLRLHFEYYSNACKVIWVLIIVFSFVVVAGFPKRRADFPVCRKCVSAVNPTNVNCL